MREVGAIVTRTMAEAGKAVAAFVVDAVKSAGDFEQGLNMLQAVTGATNDQMKAIHDEAIALGNDMSLPATSAQDAADAMTELAKAGLSVDDTMAAAKGTLQLATAAETDAGTAAQIVAGSLNAFHLQGADATKVADLLAAAANASSANMTDLAQGLQQGGFMFNATGQKIDDLTASLAILTNVGLTGSDAGTALKNAMVRLTNPTDKAAGVMQDLGINVYDANGKMLPFRDVIGVISKATAGMTDEQKNAALGTIFLSDGMKAMLPLLDVGVAGFDEMKAKVNESGAASALAGSQMKGFNGAMAAVSNAVDTLKLIIGEQLLPLLTPLINQFAAGVGAVGEFAMSVFSADDPLSALIQKLYDLSPSLSEFVSWLRDAIPRAIGYMSSFWTGTLLPAIQSAMQFFSTRVLPILSNLATALFPLLNAAIRVASGFWTDVLVPGIKTFGKFVGDVVLPIVAALAEWLKDNLPGAIQATADFLTGTVFPAFHTVYDFISTKVIPILADIAKWLIENVPIAIKKTADFWNNTLWPALQNVWSFINDSVIPTIQTIAGAVFGALDDATSTTAGIWTGTLKPALDAVWGFIDQHIIPIFKALADLSIAAVKLEVAALAALWRTVLQPALEAVWGFIDKNINPILKFMADTAIANVKKALQDTAESYNTYLKPALDSLWDFLNNQLQSILKDARQWFDSAAKGLDGITRAIKTAVDWIGNLIDKFNELSGTDTSKIQQQSPSLIELGLRGITSAIQELLAQPDPFAILGDSADQMMTAIQDVAAAIKDAYTDMADLVRQQMSNLSQTARLDQGRIYANQKLAEIMKQANEIAKTDPAKAKEFYQVESRHALETAQLYDERRKAQQELADAQAAMQHTQEDLASFTPEEYAAEQERLRLAQQRLDILNQQYDAMQEAQRLEKQAFQAGYLAPPTGQMQAIAEAMRQLLTAKGVPGILNDPTGVIQALYNLMSQLLNIPHRAAGGPVRGGQPYLVGEHGPELFMPWMSGLVSPLASASQMAAPSYTTNSSSTVNYSPTYAQPPGSPAYDLAILGAFGV